MVAAAGRNARDVEQVLGGKGEAGEWAARAAKAAAAGRVLRYVVTATSRSVSARLLEVPAASPTGTLSGTRNLVAFTTRRYRTEPLVISGPGAGAEVTAAGILNDIYSLSDKGL